MVETNDNKPSKPDNAANVSPGESSTGRETSNVSDISTGVRNSNSESIQVEEESSETEAKLQQTDELEMETLQGMDKEMEEYVKNMAGVNMLSINSIKLSKEYPLVYNIIFEHFKKKSILPENVNVETVIGALLYAPRTFIYNLFDDNEIFINIKGCHNKWTYTIWEHKNSEDSQEFYANRTEAEIAAINTGFTILEEKIQKQIK